MKILIVEDEEKVAKLVKMALENDCHHVELAGSGEEAIKLADVNEYDLIVLDIMLPGKNGMAVTKYLRKKNIKWPILMLTALNSVDNKVKALDYGADDYLTKPYKISELQARVRALGRREVLVHWPKLIHRELEIDQSLCKASVNGKDLVLSPQEYQILDFLLRHKNEMSSKTMLGEHIWGLSYCYSSEENKTINVIISKIRKKISNLNGSRNVIMSGSQYGYRLI